MFSNKKKLEFRVTNRFDYFLLFQVILIVMFVFQFWVESGYQNRDFGLRIGWQSKDGPPNLSSGHIGNHYFSDYTGMVESSRQSNPWLELNNYPPFAMLIFKFFAIFPNRIGLLVWLTFSIFFLLLPLLFIKKSGINNSQKILLGLIYVVSSPFISVLDRGNLIFILPLLILLSYINLKEKSPLLAGFFLGTAVAIKIYPILLILFFIRERHYKAILSTLITALGFTFFSSLFFGNPVLILNDVIPAVLGHNQLAVEPQPMIFSGVGILHNLALALFGGESTISQVIFENATKFSLGLLILIAIYSFGKQGLFRFLPILFALQLVPVQSYTYSRIWALIALPLLVNEAPSRLKRIWLLIVGLNLSPFVMDIGKSINLLPTFSFLILGSMLISSSFSFLNAFRDSLRRNIRISNV